MWYLLSDEVSTAAEALQMSCSDASRLADGQPARHVRSLRIGEYCACFLIGLLNDCEYL